MNGHGRRAGGRGAWLLLCLGLVFLAGCGRKTPLVPPAAVVPEAVTDLAVSLDAGGATLTWSFPRRATRGRPLERIDGFEIWRAAHPDDQCRQCPQRLELLRVVPGGIIPARVFARTGRFRDAGLRPGYRYTYQVRARTSALAVSEPSNRVSFVWQAPPGQVRNLVATAGDGQVVLAWEPPAAFLDTTPVRQPLAYRVVRLEGQHRRLAADGLTATRFTDGHLANGVPVTYRVQGLRPAGEGLWIAGLASEPVTATPQDLTPPAPVRRIWREGDRLHWTPAVASDLAAYRVYRRCGEERHLLATTSNTTWIATEPAVAGCAYLITAVDAAGNESQPSPELPIPAP